MPKKFAAEFERDVVRVARRGDLSHAEVAVDFETFEDGAALGAPGRSRRRCHGRPGREQNDLVQLRRNRRRLKMSSFARPARAGGRGRQVTRTTGSCSLSRWRTSPPPPTAASSSPASKWWATAGSRRTARASRQRALRRQSGKPGWCDVSSSPSRTLSNMRMRAEAACTSPRTHLPQRRSERRPVDAHLAAVSAASARRWSGAGRRRRRPPAGQGLLLPTACIRGRPWSVVPRAPRAAWCQSGHRPRTWLSFIRLTMIPSGGSRPNRPGRRAPSVIAPEVSSEQGALGGPVDAQERSVSHAVVAPRTWRAVLHERRGARAPLRPSACSRACHGCPAADWEPLPRPAG